MLALVQGPHLMLTSRSWPWQLWWLTWFLFVGRRRFPDQESTAQAAAQSPSKDSSAGDSRISQEVRRSKDPLAQEKCHPGNGWIQEQAGPPWRWQGREGGWKFLFKAWG